MSQGELLLCEVNKAIKRFYFYFLFSRAYLTERSHCLLDMAWVFFMG